MAEDPETGRLNIDKCAELSRALAVVLDVEDVMSGKYNLEVSSPGIDRPLVRIRDFERHIGLEVKLETLMPNENGQKRWRGRIRGVNDEGIIHLSTDHGDAHIEFSSLTKAKLVLTDELIKETAKMAKKA